MVGFKCCEEDRCEIRCVGPIYIAHCILTNPFVSVLCRSSLRNDHNRHNPPISAGLVKIAKIESIILYLPVSFANCESRLPF